ncbi:cAMP-specific 3',5'-cyclic phosphodiesterase 7B [Trichonephila clavipes]|nr:cAMP-specific 3',5'-cyclic phosphodiesterase 7B [Trichonephila clavipes]
MEGVALVESDGFSTSDTNDVCEALMHIKSVMTQSTLIGGGGSKFDETSNFISSRVALNCDINQSIFLFPKALLSKSNSWAFNTFNLDVSTGGRPLSNLLVHLFQEYGFVEYFKLDIVKVWHCFNLMEAAYHRHNPYHNSVHAADVTQAMHCFLQETKFASNLTHLEAMASVIAAVAHDLDHPGVTQAFLVATSNHLVNLCHVIFSIYG